MVGMVVAVGVGVAVGVEEVAAAAAVVQSLTMQLGVAAIILTAQCTSSPLKQLQ